MEHNAGCSMHPDARVHLDCVASAPTAMQFDTGRLWIQRPGLLLIEEDCLN